MVKKSKIKNQISKTLYGFILSEKAISVKGGG